MNPTYFFFAWINNIFGALLLGSLPLFPWWVWLLILITIWTLLIWLVPLPWWSWVILAVLTTGYLFVSLVIATLQAG